MEITFFEFGFVTFSGYIAVMTSSSNIPDSEIQRIDAILTHERRLWGQGLQSVAGVDEAGRGPLAGPVVAAAVIFPDHIFIPYINDSKKLTPKRREMLFDLIHEKALDVSIGLVSSTEIDAINILRATHRTMREAVAGLKVIPDHVLVDGRDAPDFGCGSTALIGGDRISFSIAAASIIAKVTRDQMMMEFDKQYPVYGFHRHKGYGTRDHVAAIQTHGPCPIHRASFHVGGW